MQTTKNADLWFTFSNYLKAGDCCGGNTAMVNSTQYGCSNHGNKGTCDNHKTVNRNWLEQIALDVIKQELLNDEIIDTVINEYNRHITTLVNYQNKTEAKGEIVKLEHAMSDLNANNLTKTKGFGIADRFRDYIKQYEADNLDVEARLSVRSMVDSVKLQKDRVVELALNPWALMQKRPAISGESLPMVAGAGFEPTTFGL